MAIAFPGESREYRAARDRLLAQEIELRRSMGAVAAARRGLPLGGLVPNDYVFHGTGTDGAPIDVRLSGLFAAGKDSLLIYSFIFPRDPDDQTPGPTTGQTALLPLAEGPCPSCTALIDQLEGGADHVSQHVNLAVVARTPLPRLLAFVEERGWRRLQFLSSAANTYNVDYQAEIDYQAETPDETQRPMLTVFHRSPDGIRQLWSSELFYAPTEPGEDPRRVGTLEPLWNARFGLAVPAACPGGGAFTECAGLRAGGLRGRTHLAVLRAAQYTVGSSWLRPMASSSVETA